ncbi:MAG: AMP-binding protein [Psychromonas sp.]
MLFNSLADLLLAPRDNLSVAFSAHKKITWQQFLADIRVLIQLIKAKKCCSIAICCDDSYLFCVAFFATVYAQKKLVLPGNHQPAMLLSLAGEFDLLISDGLVKTKIVPAFITLPIKNAQQYKFKFSTLNLDAIDLTLFTSGSTGTPKAIKKNLLMLDTEIEALENQFGHLLGQSRIVSTVSHQHIYGLLFRVLWPLCAGRAFASTDIIYPEQVIANTTPKQILISSPALLKRLVYDGKQGNYRAVFSSGGPLSSDASDLCKQLLKQTAIEVFGSTETGGIGFRQQHETDSLWTFFPQLKTKLGSENCLALLSPWLSKGLTECDNNHAYYQTSDQCELFENQQFRLNGRIDSIVKIEEKRISLVEVEKHINSLPWIAESVVIVITEAHRVTLGALLKLTPKGKQALASLGKGKFWIILRHALRDWVEPVAIPRHFRITPDIPINKQGKRLALEIAALFK